LKKFKRNLIKFLAQGITPKKLALCIALGIALGMAPVIGITTLLCTLAAFLFRLNLAAIQLVNYIAYPLQILLIIPFIRAGEWMFGSTPLGLSVDQILAMVQENPWNAIGELWSVTLQALVVWLLILPVVVGIVFAVVAPLLKRLNQKRKTTAGSTGQEILPALRETG
jgi:uncharacterized protein (DUF2062 family)